MQQGQPPQAAPPGNLNWPAIHAAFAQHASQPQNAQQPPMQPGQQPQPQVGGTPAPASAGAPQPQPGGGIPQPIQNGPAYATMIHAMAQQPANPGEDQATLILKSYADQLKRITPDVSNIHKDTMKPNTGGGVF